MQMQSFFHFLFIYSFILLFVLFWVFVFLFWQGELNLGPWVHQAGTLLLKILLQALVLFVW
jgi:hypothetical protein